MPIECWRMEVNKVLLESLFCLCIFICIFFCLIKCSWILSLGVLTELLLEKLNQVFQNSAVSRIRIQ